MNNLDNELSREMNRVQEFMLTEHYVEGFESVALLEDNTIIYIDGQMISNHSDLDREIFTTILEETPEGDSFILSDIQGRDYLVKLSSLGNYFSDDIAVIMYRDLEPVKDSLRAIVSIFVLSALILNLITTVFAFYLIHKLTSPLIRLKEASYRVLKEPNLVVPIKSRDELGELTLAFNRMNRNISKNIEALTNEKNLRETIFSSIHEGILYFDHDKNLLYSNQPGQYIYDKRNQEGAEGLSNLFENINFMIDNKTSEEGQITFDDEHYHVTSIPISNVDITDGLVIVFRNVTEEVNMQRTRSDFISTVSHELKTPMVMLTGYSEALLDDVVTDPKEVKEMISVIKDESERMNHMVNELLQLQQLEQGQSSLNISCYNVLDLFKQIEKTFSLEIESNGLNLVIDVEESLESLFDYDKMIQVLVNLVDNAIRYTREGDEIRFTGREEADEIVLIISDTGTGISKKNQKHIFERFYKVDEARTRGKHGTGLGLYIVSQIIKQHQGTIEVDSELNKGTSFIIRLPKERENVHETF
uniref:histidine kinase n=1 Tax=Aliicoccus persicus TaxID=930138 RepID=A0A921DWL2_9STAP|nr:cell wall metabolism sensor histidine kinase WalK [Aliicoccus persicus]